MARSGRSSLVQQEAVVVIELARYEPRTMRRLLSVGRSSHLLGHLRRRSEAGGHYGWVRPDLRTEDALVVSPIPVGETPETTKPKKMEAPL